MPDESPKAPMTAAHRVADGPTPRDYHERSKHCLDHFAPGPGSIDWDEQPDAFRTFAGTERVLLPLHHCLPEVPFAALAVRDQRLPMPMGLETIGLLLRHALGISAWKAMGEARWAVRCNPSSGNLHPVEAYVVVPPMNGVRPGVHHYDARHHALSLRCPFDENGSRLLTRALPGGAVLLGLSVVPWREAWKYGLRAWRYCQLDLGHAIAALDYAAAALGWCMVPVPNWDAARLGLLLGLDRAGDFEPDEPELPQALLLLSPHALAPRDLALDAAQFGFLANAPWAGRANRLGGDHVYHWRMVDAMGAASGPIAADPRPQVAHGFPPPGPDHGQTDAASVLLQRRSARTFDTRASISASVVYRLLDACLERPGAPPFAALTGAQGIQFALFIHRVRGLDPGLYALARNPRTAATLKAQMRPEFHWSKPADCPGHLPLYLLIKANARTAAARLACGQGIAGDASLTLAMFAELPATASQGRYDALLREAGALGQVLYLEAQAEALGSTGIGCFFDDPIHELLGLAGRDLQTLYLFAIGPALPDPLLIHAPAYQRDPTTIFGQAPTASRGDGGYDRR